MAQAAAKGWHPLSPGVTMLLPIVVSGCTTDQSALHPASQHAADVARLFWIMVAGGAVIWLIVIGAAIYAVIGRHRPTSERAADHVILYCGVVFPTVTLGALLAYGLTLLPDWAADEAPDLRVHIRAEQYWWRVTYEPPEGSGLSATVETANEVVLPAGATVDFHLTSPDVIHSFWIPPLGGKMDAIPGRENVLRLEPLRVGVYRGVCAEFCGAGHAFMAFRAEVVEPATFADWLARQSTPAQGDATAFINAGCGACHRVRGIVEQGNVGPDLTHIASRASIAGILPNTDAAMRDWLRDPRAVKPDARMPTYAGLPEAELEAIVTFLRGLD
jgi:cytochrome c oxidase subunit II